MLAPALIACSQPVATAPAPTSPPPAADPTPPAALPSPASPATGPGGMTLDEEVGAVLIVGFTGPLTGAVLDDWRLHQYGAFVTVNLNHNAATPEEMKALIAQLRTATRHHLLAATDQEGGEICLAIQSVPCPPMPVSRAGMATMAAGLRDLGFDLDLAPVADVCTGPSSYMWGRCYGTDPPTVSAAVTEAVGGIHSAGLLAAAKHFPGHGSATGNSHLLLPKVDESLATLQSRDWPPFKAAVAAKVDFVMIGHLDMTALDPGRPTSISPASIQRLRGDVGYTGAVMSDDLQMEGVTAQVSTPEAAVRFLVNGGDMPMVAHDLAVADATFDAIKAAVLSGRLTRARLDEAVLRIPAPAPH